MNIKIRSTDELTNTWKDAPNRWGHPLHSLAPYVGGFPPSLAHYFIKRYTTAGDTVADPMCGGGTVPLEAALENRNGWGNDLFTYAHTLSRAKCNPLQTEELKSHLDSKISASDEIDNTGMKLLENDDLSIFYSDYTLDKLLRLRETLNDDSSDKTAYLNGLICGILHGPSDMFLSLQTKDTYSGSVNYVRKYAERNDLERPERDIWPNVIKNHNRANRVHVPSSLNDRTRITQTDVRSLQFASNSVDLIITSPPYMAKLDYTWDNWIRLWWLNADRDSERDGLDLTEDVEKYRTFMRRGLCEMYRVLKPDSFAILIVGDVRKSMANNTRTINTAGLIAEEAKNETDFEVRSVLEDSYNVEDRRYIVFNQVKYDYDDTEKDDMAMIDRCLVLEKGKPDVPEPPEIEWHSTKY